LLDDAAIEAFGWVDNAGARGIEKFCSKPVDRADARALHAVHERLKMGAKVAPDAEEW